MIGGLPARGDFLFCDHILFTSDTQMLSAFFTLVLLHYHQEETGR